MIDSKNKIKTWQIESRNLFGEKRFVFDEKVPEAPSITLPEAPKKPEAPASPELASVAAGREQRDALLHEVSDAKNLSPADRARLEAIRKTKEANRAEQEKLIQTAPGSRDSWVDHPAKNNTIRQSQNVDGEIAQQIDAIFQTNPEGMNDLLQKYGLNDANNQQILKQICTSIMGDYFDREIEISLNPFDAQSAMSDAGKQKIKADLKKYGEETLLKGKVVPLFGQIDQIYENNKEIFTTPLAVLEKFSELSNMGIIKNGVLQNSLKDFLLLSDYKPFIDNLTQWAALEKDNRKLEGEEAQLLGNQLDEKGLLATITLNQTRFTIPEGTDSAAKEKAIRDGINGAIPVTVNDAQRQKMIDYLYGEMKDVKAGETIEIESTGKFKKIDLADEQAQKDQAGKEQAAQTAAASTPDEYEAQPTSLDKWGDDNGPLIKFLVSILKMFGIKGDPIETMPQDVMEMLGKWENITDEEKNGVRGLLRGLKEDRKMEGDKLKNIYKLLADPAKARPVLQAKKGSGDNWKKFLENNLTVEEQADLEDANKTLTPEQIQKMLLPTPALIPYATPEPAPATPPPPEIKIPEITQTQLNS